MAASAPAGDLAVAVSPAVGSGEPGTPPVLGAGDNPPVVAAAAPLGAGLPGILESGRPGMGSAELASLPRVGFWPRLGATGLDMILVAIFCGVISASGGIFLLVLVAYHIGMWVWKGTTVGGAILGLKCVRIDGRVLSWQIAAVRVLGCFVSLAAFGLGFFWASWTPDRQAWHDIIAGTTVVKLPKPVSLV
jgi:uncharacterized RDD family membrane protein YckC